MCEHIEDAFFSNRSPLKTVVSKTVVSTSDSSVINLLVGSLALALSQ